VLDSRPLPTDEADYNEAKATVERLLALVNKSPIAKPQSHASSSGQDSQMSVDQQDQPLHASVDPSSTAVPLGTSVENEFTLQEIMSLTQDYIYRHPEVLVLVQQASKYGHLIAYKNGMELYKSRFGDRTGN